jgi:hypothetical protein
MQCLLPFDSRPENGRESDRTLNRLAGWSKSAMLAGSHVWTQTPVCKSLQLRCSLALRSQHDDDLKFTALRVSAARLSPPTEVASLLAKRACSLADPDCSWSAAIQIISYCIGA